MTPTADFVGFAARLTCAGGRELSEQYNDGHANVFVCASVSLPLSLSLSLFSTLSFSCACVIQAADQTHIRGCEPAVALTVVVVERPQAEVERGSTWRPAPEAAPTQVQCQRAVGLG